MACPSLGSAILPQPLQDPTPTVPLTRRAPVVEGQLPGERLLCAQLPERLCSRYQGRCSPGRESPAGALTGPGSALTCSPGPSLLLCLEGVWPSLKLMVTLDLANGEIGLKTWGGLFSRVDALIHAAPRSADPWVSGSPPEHICPKASLPGSLSRSLSLTPLELCQQEATPHMWPLDLGPGP